MSRALDALIRAEEIIHDYLGDPTTEDGWKNEEVRDAWLDVKAALAAEAKIELCACSLSGECHVIKDGKACDLCSNGERLAFTPENVQRMFDGYAKRTEA